MTIADDVVIRPMTASDVELVSAIILRAVRETNAADYPPDFIAAMLAKNTPEKVAVRRANSQVLVAVEGRNVVGTASLGPERINAVFVSPDHQRGGIGRALIVAVEALARKAGRDELRLNSTVTAARFYERLGFCALPVCAERPGLRPMHKCLA